MISVPAAAVSAAIDECVAKGVKGVVVITAGFGETGEEGRRLEAALLEKVRDAGMRMVGPNCMGLVNTNPAVRLNATFAPTYPPEGRVALSSQSGALGLALLDYAARLNLGISTFVSVGNKADVSSNDLVQYWAEDPRTDVILLYLESFGSPGDFSRIARRVARRKPIVAVKAGRSRAGARAASSHTGALAESDTVVDALFRQAGVIRTGTLEELFDVAALLAHQPVPRGGRVAIVTNAGGPGILAADACEAQGLELPPLAAGTADALRAFLPAAASVANPVDMLASAPPEHYERALRLVLADPNVDSVLTIFIPPVATDSDAVARAIVEGTRDGRREAGPRHLHERPRRAADAAADPELRLSRARRHRPRARGRVRALARASPPAPSRSSAICASPRPAPSSMPRSGAAAAGSTPWSATASSPPSASPLCRCASPWTPPAPRRRPGSSGIPSCSRRSAPRSCTRPRSAAFGWGSRAPPPSRRRPSRCRHASKASQASWSSRW